MPIHEGIAEYALISAFRDTRFSPIEERELETLECGCASSIPPVPPSLLITHLHTGSRCSRTSKTVPRTSTGPSACTASASHSRTHLQRPHPRRVRRPHSPRAVQRRRGGRSAARTARRTSLRSRLNRAGTGSRPSTVRFASRDTLDASQRISVGAYGCGDTRAVSVL